MAELKGPLEILKLLDKSNCKACGKPTCLAFASMVFKGEKRLDECPRLGSEIIGRYRVKTAGQPSIAQMQAATMAQLKRRIATIDLASAARRLGAPYMGGKLTIQCLGKNFRVDAAGEISTDIHVNPWVAAPIFNYIMDGGGVPVAGEWVTFRELKNGADWYPLYRQRCEKPLKKVADTCADLFDDMLHIFSGKRIDYHYPAEISIVLHPLPKLPILICYSGPEEGLESNLVLFFDATAEENLNIESIYGLIAGLVLMFEKIALRHGQS
jgi:hypothetical protein